MVGKCTSMRNGFIVIKKIEVVDKFNYLGVLLNFNDKFTVMQNNISEQGRKAVFALKRNFKSLYLNFNIMLSLFDTYINSSLSYACEIWGAHKAPGVERVHMSFCKNLLNVKSSTNTLWFIMNKSNTTDTL